MLLRRVIAHFRKQEWTAIALDFLIVVVGVFIGIQVANWNDAVADKRLGADYEQRLAADLTKDLQMLRGINSYYRDVLASVVATGTLLNQSSPDPQTLLTSAYRATEINYNPQISSTWNQVVSSGHLGLLSNDATAYAAEYFAFDFVKDAYELLASSAYRHRVRSLIPLHVQQEIRRGCSDVRNEIQIIVGFMPDCDLDLDAETIAQVAERLYQDGEVRNALNFQYSHVYTSVVNTQGLAVLVEQGLKEIGHEVAAQTVESDP